ISQIFADKTQQNLQTASLFAHLRKSAKSAGGKTILRSKTKADSLSIQLRNLREIKQQMSL
ncbi:MAG: hypothetical protein K9J45_22170, partial [Bacteroidales bacterium]|nr:hypothetical protein [Bacteroidales bacterium]